MRALCARYFYEEDKENPYVSSTADSLISKQDF